LITVSQALAESRNVPTVRLANALGPEKIAEIANRFGLKQEFPPYLSIALGSVEVTLAEIVSAFSSFPNHGVRAEPYLVNRVEDYNGVVLEEHRGRVYDAVVTPEVAEKMLFLLREVVRRGSGAQARQLGRPLGGKTGTTNESTDTWFVGFTPRITAGVWVGFDEKKSLGERLYGSNLALPIWIEFMKRALVNEPIEEFDSSWLPDDRTASRVIETEGGVEGELPNEEGLGHSPSNPYQVEDIAPPPAPDDPR
jgi:penicillin-binding protein 1A